MGLFRKRKTKLERQIEKTEVRLEKEVEELKHFLEIIFKKCVPANAEKLSDTPIPVQRAALIEAKIKCFCVGEKEQNLYKKSIDQLLKAVRNLKQQANKLKGALQLIEISLIRRFGDSLEQGMVNKLVGEEKEVLSYVLQFEEINKVAESKIEELRTLKVSDLRECWYIHSDKLVKSSFLSPHMQREAYNRLSVPKNSKKSQEAFRLLQNLLEITNEMHKNLKILQKLEAKAWLDLHKHMKEEDLKRLAD